MFCTYMCLNACFTSDHHILQSIQGQTYYGCMNHDNVVGLCSEVLMRLSNFTHLGFGKVFWLIWDSNPGPSSRESSTLPFDQSVKSINKWR